MDAVWQEGLARALFPLGDLLKSKVRELAAGAGLHVAAKRDSVGICFVGKRSFRDFIGGYLQQAPGDFVCVESGAVLGQHRGVAQYTPGQRARLGGSPHKRYVVSTAHSTWHMARGTRHTALGTWRMAHSTRHTTLGTRHTAHSPQHAGAQHVAT